MLLSVPLMAGARTSLLCTGDIHIGRRPSRLPDRADPHRFAAASMWIDIADEAVSRGVDAVVLTGDIVDQDNRYFEALGPLEDGLATLEDSGIPVYAVAGNHDCKVLPQLVDDVDMPGLHLLGRGGTWTRESLEVDGEPVLHLDGWSFPQEHVRTNPLESYDLVSSDLPVIGLLHTEVDSPEGRYAPTTLSDLEHAGPDAWVLGHIHAPGRIDDDGPVPILYPGSPQPLDPGERGCHGPWIADITSEGIHFEQLPLATVRYDHVPVDLSTVSNENALRPALTDALREHAEEAREEHEDLRELVLRVALEGRTGLHGAIPSLTEGMVEDLNLNVHETKITVEKVRIDTRPDVDIDELAEGHDPPAILAKIVQRIDQGEGVPPDLTQAVSQKAREVYKAPAFAAVREREDDAPPDGSELEDRVRNRALDLLHALLIQKEDPAGE